MVILSHDIHLFQSFSGKFTKKELRNPMRPCGWEGLKIIKIVLGWLMNNNLFGYVSCPFVNRSIDKKTNKKRMGARNQHVCRNQ